MLVKGSKSPVSAENKTTWKTFYDDANSYILGLTNEEGKQLVKTSRKTGFLGFLIAIKKC